MEKYESVHGIDGEGDIGEEEKLRLLTDLGIMRGLSGPTVPFCLATAAADFNDDIDSIDDT
eukprot:14856416-Ditylum_brightwellii.AAC.2